MQVIEGGGGRRGKGLSASAAKELGLTLDKVQVSTDSLNVICCCVRGGRSACVSRSLHQLLRHMWSAVLLASADVLEMETVFSRVKVEGMFFFSVELPITDCQGEKPADTQI